MPNATAPAIAAAENRVTSRHTGLLDAMLFLGIVTMFISVVMRILLRAPTKLHRLTYEVVHAADQANGGSDDDAFRAGFKVPVDPVSSQC